MLARPLVGLAVAVALATAPGCGAMFGGSQQRVRVICKSPGATVSVVQQSLRVAAPAEFYLPRERSYTLTVEAPGYLPQQMPIHRSLRAGIVILDVLLTGLIGVVVDAATGAWYELSPDEIHLTLQRDPAARTSLPERLPVSVRLDDRSKEQLGVTVSAPHPVTLHFAAR